MIESKESINRRKERSFRYRPTPSGDSNSGSNAGDQLLLQPMGDSELDTMIKPITQSYRALKQEQHKLDKTLEVFSGEATLNEEAISDSLAKIESAWGANYWELKRTKKYRLHILVLDPANASNYQLGLIDAFNALNQSCETVIRCADQLEQHLCAYTRRFASRNKPTALSVDPPSQSIGREDSRDGGHRSHPPSDRQRLTLVRTHQVNQSQICIVKCECLSALYDALRLFKCLVSACSTELVPSL